MSKAKTIDYKVTLIVDDGKVKHTFPMTCTQEARIDPETGKVLMAHFKVLGSELVQHFGKIYINPKVDAKKSKKS